MRIATMVAAATLALCASAAQAQDIAREGIDDTPSAGAMAFDLLIVRPVGVVATVAGVGLFILTVPLSIIQGEPPVEPARMFIQEPAKFTFQRPLGEMSE